MRSLQSIDPIAFVKDLLRRFTPDGALMLGVYIGASAVIAVPLVAFSGARWANTAEDDDLQGEQQDYDNYNNNDGDGDGDGDEDCGWFQFTCNANGPDSPNVPWWWVMANYERRRDQSQEPVALMLVIYFWTLAMMIYIIRFIGRMVKAGQDLSKLTGPLIMTGVYCLSGMLYLGTMEGAVKDDGDVVDEHGWYGQVGVLLYMTLLFLLLMCGGLVVVITNMSYETLLKPRKSPVDLSYERNRAELEERVRTG